MSKLVGLCRTATTFTKSGELDENAMRQYLQMFNDAKIGVHLASGGSGEGHALTDDELRRVYKIGVETCGGKVQVNATTPERHTARANIEQIELAISQGIEVVNLYGPTSWHGYKPTLEEYVAYHDRVLTAIKHPVAIAPNPVIGFAAEPAVIARIVNKYSQIVAVNLAGQDDDAYFIQLKDMVKRKVEFYVKPHASMEAMSLGAAGVIGGEFALCPMICRRYLNLYEKKKYDEANKAYADIKRLSTFVKRWRPANARWLKMGMKLLKLPGGEGGVREPYIMPSKAEYKLFSDGLLRLGIPEIDQMARAAGLTIPS